MILIHAPISFACCTIPVKCVECTVSSCGEMEVHCTPHFQMSMKIWDSDPKNALLGKMCASSGHISSDRTA